MSVTVSSPPMWRASRLHAQEYLSRALPSLAEVRVVTLGETDLLCGPPRFAPPEDGGATLVVIYLYGHLAVVCPPGTAGCQEPPCYCCVARRWQELRSAEERDTLERGNALRPVGEIPWLTAFSLRALADLVVTALQAPAGRPPGPYQAYVYELRLDALITRRRIVVADPDCPVCGTPVPDGAGRVIGEPVSRRKPAPDTYRLRDAGDFGLTLDAYANPLCGSLGSMAIPAYDSPTSAPVTGFTRVRGRAGLHEFFWSGHANSYERSAWLGLLEGLERYAGLAARGLGPRVVASLRELSHPALDPRAYGVYVDEFYDFGAPYYTRFTPDLPIPWVWGYSLRDKRPILVPERLVYYLGRDTGPNFVEECSNGCAIGSCAEEAILHGMLELIERDAFLLCWYGKIRLPEIDPDSCSSSDTRFMVDRLRMIGYDVRLFDNRIDFPIPVVTGVAVRRDGRLGSLCFGAGSGMEPEEAVRAALCEFASYVPNFEERMLESLDEARAMSADYSRVKELRHHSLLFGLPEMAHHADFMLGRPRPRPIGEIYADWDRARPRHHDLADDLRYCQGLLTEAGFDVIVVDQTPPDQRRAGLATMCVIVPGLLPIDFGWHKQRVLHMPRLRTAARRAGLREDDLGADQINFVPHPFP
jgi:ribosomal protein S12 methylthiotransferase accessory factor